MARVMDYVRMVLFLCGVMAGIQIPSFMDAYGKSLEARLLESTRSLAGFQQDADRYFSGDIKALVHHYRESGDPVFGDGGESIHHIHERNLELQEALAAFQKGWFRAFFHVFVSPVKDVRDFVWEHYDYSLKLNGTAIIAGLMSGILTALFPEMLFAGLVRMVRRPKRPGRHPGGSFPEGFL
ncbi:DUF2937 family protein [Desulfobotulus sp. H1]|uniref:DUF2937 family protein n=1 Tax=Desulfobotulus pelophilus TaxID=2823377 RepID=A0ABT3N9X5_9BACT|nr:DUF2937 family protein [Desulfobotulus pelophilus]MCW7754267.1 DUF2937 family protein [Desulfobotulus pelophilus]